MTAFAMLPPIPRPPDDPTSLTLDSGRGWRVSALDGTAIDAVDGTLTLGVAAGSRTFDEPSGSFGGLAPPSLVAVSEGCDVWLIDPATCQLLVLDRCDCVFKAVPGVGGTGSAPRQFKDPHGIVASRGNLFAADTGNARVSVFSMRGYMLRGTLSVPVNAITNPWVPAAIAADPRGRIYVGDPANGCVHRFTAHGVWEMAIRNLGAVVHIAVDCRGWLYVVTATSSDARVFDGLGEERDAATAVADVRNRFATLPFRVDVNGALDFSRSGGPCCCAFDSHGAVLPNGAVGDALALGTDGTFRSQPLDSGIAECQWHRVRLCGALPVGTSVTVLTRSSEVAEPDDLVAALPDDAWDTWQVARRPKNAQTDDACIDWDCLVRSGPGRFLWVRFRLRGTGKVTPRIESVTLEMPRISMARYLPGVFSADPGTSDFTDRFLAIFDTSLRSIERELDAQAGLFDPRSTPATPGAPDTPDFLSWLASWVGIVFDRNWPEDRRRRYLRAAPALFDLRGTVPGIRAVLLLYLGLGDPMAEAASCGCGQAAESDDPERCRFPNRCCPPEDPCAPPAKPKPHRLPVLLLEHWRLRRWMFVGLGRLGEESMLWGTSIVNRSQLDQSARVGVTQLIGSQDPYRDPFYVYASTFTVFIPACFARDAIAKKGLENLLKDQSPAHTRWHLELVEPRFRVGVQSMIGYDSVVGRYPTPQVTLDTTTLGRSTVLGGVPDESRGPSMRVGSTARVGSTTVLS